MGLCPVLSHSFSLGYWGQNELILQVFTAFIGLSEKHAEHAKIRPLPSVRERQVHESVECKRAQEEGELLSKGCCTWCCVYTGSCNSHLP